MRMWKAVLILGIIVGLAGWGYWATHGMHTVDSGTLPLAPGAVNFRGMSLERPFYVQADFTPPPGSQGKYVVAIVKMSQVTSLLTAPPSDLQGFGRVEGSGPLKLGPVGLDAGNYQVVILNKSDQSMDIKFNIQAKKKPLTWDDDTTPKN